jgi:hypothetical protein
MDTRLPTDRDPISSRIQALPVNGAHRASAQASYRHAESIVDRAVRVHDLLRLVAARVLALGSRESAFGVDGSAATSEFAARGEPNARSPTPQRARKVLPCASVGNAEKRS